MALLEVSHLTVRYEHHIACEDVSFSLAEGDYAAIVGENGSGKSTLVKTLVGLIPPASGEVRMNGIERREIGYLPQSTVVQKDFPASVTEVVMTGCIGKGGFHPFYTSEQKKTAHDMMELLGVTPFAKKSFRELSGGQQQRVLLARSLCAAKDLLVLDEPVTGLDPAVTDELYTIIRKLNQEENLAVIMVSHDVHRAVQNASHILHMDKEVAFFGTTGEYQKNPLYNDLSHVEVCQTHLCTHCGSDCNASHIILGQHSH